jgi:hypothetical protein
MFRIGLMGGFAEIARSHHRRMCDARSRIPARPYAAPDSDEYIDYERLVGPIESEVTEAASIAIVFAAIAAESYIYDFAGKTLGDRYVERHLDRLSMQSKWVVVSKLAAGYAMPSDGRAFQVLGELTHDRNEIVHHKTRDAIPIWGTEAFLKFVEYANDLHNRADRAIRALDVLSKESKKFDSTGFDYFDGGTDTHGVG